MGERGEGGCEDAVQALYLFLDNELAGERRAEIQRHLEDCPPCYEAYEFEFELWRVVASKCREHQVPESLRERIIRDLRPGPGIAEV